jgi:hypothetical protein
MEAVNIVAEHPENDIVVENMPDSSEGQDNSTSAQLNVLHASGHEAGTTGIASGDHSDVQSIASLNTDHQEWSETTSSRPRSISNDLLGKISGRNKGPSLNDKYVKTYAVDDDNFKKTSPTSLQPAQTKTNPTSPQPVHAKHRKNRRFSLLGWCLLTNYLFLPEF